MKKIVRVLFKIAIGIVLFLAIYFGLAFLFGKIETERINSKEPKKYQALILSNGVHTDMVLPVKNDLIDWRTIFPTKNTRAKKDHLGWIAFGWGDKGFYLNTPTWGDLTFSTAFKAVSGLSSTALHVTYRDTIKLDSTNCIQLKLTKKEFLQLKKYIHNSFQVKNRNAIHIPTDAVYGDDDAFYEATGTYHLFNTCNTWTNDALKSCNQKACSWTPFESGIYDLYRK
jgi:uncharacterized protein (TIGR02117 family)